MHLQVRVTNQKAINSPYCLLSPTHTHLCLCGLKHRTAKNYRRHVGTLFRHNDLQTPTSVNGTLMFLHTRSSGASFEQTSGATHGNKWAFNSWCTLAWKRASWCWNKVTVHQFGMDVLGCLVSQNVGVSWMSYPQVWDPQPFDLPVSL